MLVERTGRISSFFRGYFSYSTVKEAKTYNFKISLIYRTLQFAIIFYILGLDIYRNKSYQIKDNGISTIVTKVTGTGYTYEKIDEKSKINTFDTSDYIRPPNEHNSIFIKTNFIETIQSEGKCPEISAHCVSDEDCTNKEYLTTWHGHPTGKCINSTSNSSINVCEVVSWCPIEQDDNISNIREGMSSEFIKECAYSEIRDPTCPVFKINQILKLAEPDENEQKIMLLKGTIVLIRILWECDLDFWWKECQPTYTFKRFDLSAISGFNFRYSELFGLNSTEYRKHVKAFGIRFVIVVNGNAGKFSFLPLFTSIGSGIGLLSLPNIVADLILLNFTKHKKFYKDLKVHDYKKDDNLLYYV